MIESKTMVSKKVKAQGTIKRKKRDGRAAALQMMRMPTNPPPSEEDQRYRLISALLNGITAATSGASIATYYIRGEKEENLALVALSDWLKSANSPPKEILYKLGDLIDPNLRSAEPQRFVLQYRKKGMGKSHKAITENSLKLTKILHNIEAEATSPNQATKKIARTSDVDVKHIEKNLQDFDKIKKK